MYTFYQLQKQAVWLLMSLVLSLSPHTCECQNPRLIEYAPQEDKDTDKKQGEPDMVINIIPGDTHLIGDKASICFKLVKDTTATVDTAKMKLKVTSKVTPSHAANDMSILLEGTPITTGELPQAAMALDKDITLKIHETQKDTIVQAEITLELLYEGETLEKGVTQQKFYWEPINSVAEELFAAIDAWDIVKIKTILASPTNKAKLKPDALNKNKDSFLFAAYNKYKDETYHQDYAEMLVALLGIPGLDINKQVNKGNLGDLLADHLHNNDVGSKATNVLLDNKAQVATGTTGMHECLRHFNWNDWNCHTNMIDKLNCFLKDSTPELVNKQDEDGNTPLHLVVGHITNDNILIITRLTSYFAQFDIPNKAGKTPRDVAKATIAEFKKNNILVKDQDLCKAFENACKPV